MIPDAKLIYIVGDPVDRTLNHYFEMHAWDPHVNMNLSEALKDYKKSYFQASKYYSQLQPGLLQVFMKLTSLITIG